MRLVHCAVVLALLPGLGCGGDDDSGSSDGAEDQPLTIMPIGDSNTQRVGASTYRCYLDQMLNEAGVSFDFVGSFDPPAADFTCPAEFDRHHEAISGVSVNQHAPQAIESAELLQPDVALVLLGAADIFNGQPADEAADELAEFIGDLQATRPDITILVGQYTPCRSTSSWCEESWPALNDAIASFADLSTEGSSVVVVDMFTGFSMDYLVDSAHPNDDGDEEMARRWMTGLREAEVIEP